MDVKLTALERARI